MNLLPLPPSPTANVLSGDLVGGVLSSDAPYWAAAGLGALYLAVSGYSAWRRRSANLTVVHAVEAGGARPAFLTPDPEARAAALERGDRFRARLDEREAAAATGTEDLEPVRRATGLLALVGSAFTLLSMIVGSLLQLRWAGTWAEELGAEGRIVAAVRAHPVAFAVAVLVVALQTARFVSERRATAA